MHGEQTKHGKGPREQKCSELAAEPFFFLRVCLQKALLNKAPLLGARVRPSGRMLA